MYVPVPIPYPHYTATPSLSSSDNTSGSSHFQFHLIQRSPLVPNILSLNSSLIRSSSRTALETRRSHTFSSYFPLKLPNVLAGLIEHLPWVYFYTLTCTCRDLRYILRIPELKDIVLSQYVPGYKLGLLHRDMLRFRDVPIAIPHLDLLLISTRMPLHHYPMRALQMLSSPYPTPEQDHISQDLTSLALAHSRFVLLLQSLVHSTTSQEPAEFRQFNPRNSIGLRELTFPAPLFLANEKHGAPLPPSSFNGHRSHWSMAPCLGRSANSSFSSGSGSYDVTNYFARTPLNLPQGRHPTSKKKIRKSVFGRPKILPPPPSEPRSLKFYSMGWRRHPKSASDDEFTPPRRGFTSINVSSDSSLNSQSNQRDSIGLMLISSSSPHDLKLAMSRTRAPILRVFVPCSDMDEESVIACEDQLIDTGLWDHLSTGDVVCNLGYIPPDTEDSGSDPDDPERVSRKWLLFNGYALIPFAPPEPPPIDDPLTLPSPFYYSHILPLHADQIFNIVLPPSDFSELPQLALVCTSTKVKGPSGYYSVKKYMWVAKVTRFARSNLARFGEGEEIGEGWKGEWVLEGEGTSEGKQILIDCIQGCEMEKRKWEFIREKSGRGRIWMKLLQHKKNMANSDIITDT